jgi:hypothetical protein
MLASQKNYNCCKYHDNKFIEEMNEMILFIKKLKDNKGRPTKSHYSDYAGGFQYIDTRWIAEETAFQKKELAELKIFKKELKMRKNKIYVKSKKDRRINENKTIRKRTV